MRWLNAVFASILLMTAGCGSAEPASSDPTGATSDPASDDPADAPSDRAEGADPDGHDEACSPPNAGGSTEFECTYDSECTVCHDGSACGVVVNTAEHARRGAECEREDAAECESSAARCCDGHCTLTSF